MARARSAASAPRESAATRIRVTASPGDEVGAAALGRTVAESLKKLRKNRQMSLDQLAATSGVSRAALSQIEGARTNPTLSVLWKIAVGLGVPFQSLLGTSDGNPTRVLRAGDAQVLRSADGRMESRLLSPAGASQNVDVYELKFSPKGILLSEPHASGTTETLIVLTGALRVSVGEETHELAPGDSIFFHADVPHAYESRSSHETRCLDIVAYASRG
ncbi:MAG TPA: XRE family transcriptional regulator [Polyangiaceae bacterium]|jgi:transcriptional regulator with XRE-family HTH domain|nr:XRE family transcriptional regulator [Polyangiaceae bacterium]